MWLMAKFSNSSILPDIWLTFNWFKGCTTFWSEKIILLWGLSRSKHTPTCTYNTVLYCLLTCITEWSNPSRCTPETSSIGNMTSIFLTAVWTGGITVIPIDPKVDTTSVEHWMMTAFTHFEREDSKLSRSLWKDSIWLFTVTYSQILPFSIWVLLTFFAASSNVNCYI